MRRFLSAGIIRIVSAFAALSITAANAQVQKRSTSAPPMMQMPIVAPLFVEDGDFTSTLILVNGSSVSTYAGVALRAPDGKTVAAQRIQLPPHNQQQVSIRTLLETGTTPNLTTGSVTVMQSPDVSPMVVVAALSITQQSSSTLHYIDQELAMPSPAGSQTLRGVADRSDGSPLVAIASLSDMPQHVTIACLGAAHSEASTVTLAPEATILTPACTGNQNGNGDLHWLAENLPNTPHRPVGIALTSDAMPGSFAAFGLAPHDSPDGRYFSSVSFTDPKTLLSATSVFTGVPVGSSPLLPEGTYTPVVALANFSQSPRHVTVSYALTRSGSSSLKTIRVITLAPLTSREVALDGLSGDPMLQDSFLIQSDGTPGDVQSKLVSRSGNSRLREVELLAKDLDDPDNGGDHPWTIADGVTSTLLLFNQSSKPQWFNVQIAAGTEVWSKGYRLQPNQTMAISVNDLRRTGAKDDKGHAFPSDLWSGQIGWNVPRKDAGRGRLLQSNPETAMARNFSCGWILEICGATLDPGSISIPVGTNDNLVQVDNIQVCMNACDGTYAGGEGQDCCNYGYTSENFSIASVSESYYPWDPDVYGASAGSTYIDGWVADGYCTVNVQSAVTVTPPPPDHLSVVVDNEGYPNQCPSTGVYLRQMEMQVVDANNQVITQNPSVAETYTSGPTTNTCGTGQPIPSSCAPTDSNGQFIDSMGVSQNLCNSGVNQSSGCGYSLTSTWSACGTSGNNTLWISPRVTLSNGVEVDGRWTQWSGGTQCTKSGC